MADTAKKPTSDTASTSIGLARPSYFRRLSALFGGGGEVETAQTTATSPPELSASSTAIGRVVSLRGSYTPPQAAEPWMKRKPVTPNRAFRPTRRRPPAPSTETPPVAPPVSPPPPRRPRPSVPTISQVIPVTQVIEPELLTKGKLAPSQGASRRKRRRNCRIRWSRPC